MLRKEDLVIFLQYERLIREASQFDRGNGSLEAEPEADVHTNGKDLKKQRVEAKLGSRYSAYVALV